MVLWCSHSGVLVLGETEETREGEYAAFAKSVIGRRLSSLFDGLLGGFLLGVVLGLLFFGQTIERPYSSDFLLLLTVLLVVSIFIILWGIYAALTTK